MANDKENYLGQIRDLQEQDNGDPLGGPGHIAAGDKSQVDRSGQHDQADEEYRPDGLHIEPIFPRRIRRHDILVVRAFVLLAISWFGSQIPLQKDS